MSMQAIQLRDVFKWRTWEWKIYGKKKIDDKGLI